MPTLAHDITEVSKASVAGDEIRIDAAELCSFEVREDLARLNLPEQILNGVKTDLARTLSLVSELLPGLVYTPHGKGAAIAHPPALRHDITPDTNATVTEDKIEIGDAHFCFFTIQEGRAQLKISAQILNGARADLARIFSLVSELMPDLDYTPNYGGMPPPSNTSFDAETGKVFHIECRLDDAARYSNHLFYVMAFCDQRLVFKTFLDKVPTTPTRFDFSAPIQGRYQFFCVDTTELDETGSSYKIRYYTTDGVTVEEGGLNGRGYLLAVRE